MDQAGAAVYLKVAEIEVTDVRPDHFGFTVQGLGADRADYRLEWHLDMPVDPRTKAVLGGLLAQSEWRVWRRASSPAPRSALRARAGRRTQKPGA